MDLNAIKHLFVGALLLFAASCGASKPSSYLVPDVVGSPSAAAKSTLEAAGWKVTVDEVALKDLERNYTGQIGDVAEQTPKANSSVSDLGTVQLLVIPGYVVVPELEELTRDEAFTQLTSVKLAVKVSTSQALLADPGTVIRSFPRAGTVVAPGASVEIVVALPRTHVVQLDLRVKDNLWDYIGDAGCEYVATDENLSLGKSVQLTGPDGNVLSAQGLTVGTVDGADCSWVVSFPDVPEVAAYSLTTSGSKWPTTSLSDMRSSNWSLGYSVKKN